MIRICLAAVAALALAACSKAPEDVTARYSLGGGQGTITVEAAGNGDARVEAGQQMLVRKGGTEYVLLTDSKGRFAAKMDDFVAAMGEVMKEGGIKPMGMPPQGEYDLAKQGSETIADVKGDVWKVSPKKGPATESFEAVISSDPAYANVGKALEMQTKLAAAQSKLLQGGESNLEKRVSEMLGKGMVLRFASALKLDKIEKGPIDAKSFELPTVLDKAGIKARMNAERERAQAAAKAMQSAQPPVQQAPVPAPAPTPTPAPKAK
ncbi:hypothetical protein MZO42_09770 [Sphingomonas psychrotolerans]|uniref:DUF4412 domain-containing protein n=1 Tax=Sphingomonas psychrotolerans TaxID=1327635 RepID=A0ABU3N363_9SPHN|nr:hypothetical protein [Sphingomonas psychrotolerans]MDT8758984.1 hypothetical protein [Sphingomonas psychrotolerans]